MTVHELKIEPVYFDEVVSGAKRFEIRKDDRDFKIGDGLFLEEWDIDHYTGHYKTFRITCISRYKQKKHYVVLGIEGVVRLTYEPTFGKEN